MSTMIFMHMWNILKRHLTIQWDISFGKTWMTGRNLGRTSRIHWGCLQGGPREEKLLHVTCYMIRTIQVVWFLVNGIISLRPHHQAVTYLKKTAALITAVRTLGCRAQRNEQTIVTASEEIQRRQLEEHQTKIRRGYVPEAETCGGRLSLEYNKQGSPFIICEHYDDKLSRDHYIHYLDGSFDVDYLDAYFNEDSDELERIEGAALTLGFGPLAVCTNIANVSSQRICCRKGSIQLS
ncbi:hypothetical protein FPV67DRAFT_1451580 [Lyophyllum atratum]|nr:hypothetical protein FPV67DRAFT_1451580 [Lyophyllum atratum]